MSELKALDDHWRTAYRELLAERDALKARLRKLEGVLKKISNFEGDEEPFEDFCFLKALARQALDEKEAGL